MWLSARSSVSRAYRSTSSARSMLSGKAADISPDSNPLPAWAKRKCVRTCVVHDNKQGQGEGWGGMGDAARGLVRWMAVVTNSCVAALPTPYTIRRTLQL